MKKKSNKNAMPVGRQGFTLMEVMFAVLVISIGVVAAYIAVQEIFVQTFSVSRRLTAAYLAEEGIEIVRNIRDTNWMEGDDWDDGLVAEGSFRGCNLSGSTPRFCEVDYDDTDLSFYNPSATDPHPLMVDTNGFYNYDSGTDSNFSRKIEIEMINPSNPSETGLKVTVTIYWRDIGQQRSLVVQSYLYEWR